MALVTFGPARREKPPGMTKGPAGRIRRALLYRQHRRQGSAGAWERRRGVAPLVWTSGSEGLAAGEATRAGVSPEE